MSKYSRYRVLDLRSGEYLNDWSEDYIRPVPHEFRSIFEAEEYISTILGYTTATRLNLRVHFEIEEMT